MPAAFRLHQVAGVCAQELRTVWLFFFHEFFPGPGSVLVYAAASGILPQSSLSLLNLAGAVTPPTGYRLRGLLTPFEAEKVPSDSLRS